MTLEAGNLIDSVDRCRVGDLAALEQLLTEIQGPVERFLSRRVSPASRELVEDMAQEALIRVAHGISSCRATNVAEFMAWVLTITRNVLVDDSRTWRREQGQRVWSDAAIANASQEFDSAAPDNLLLPLLMQAYADLPPLAAELVWYRLVQQASWREIADVFQTAPSAMKRRFQRIQQRLRNDVLRRIDKLPPAQQRRGVRVLRRMGLETREPADTPHPDTTKPGGP